MQGTALLKEGMAPDFWRAPTDNDRGAGLQELIKRDYVKNKLLSESVIWKNATNT